MVERWSIRLDMTIPLKLKKIKNKKVHINKIPSHKFNYYITKLVDLL